jgi:hypothetical protein
MPTYVVLGIGARAVDFQGESWDFPGGRIGWIRWHDSEVYPATFMAWPDDAMSYEEMEARRLDYAPSAVRFTIIVDVDEPEAAELASAVADGMAGLVQFDSPFPVEFSITSALEPEWVERGEARLEDLEARDRWMGPFGIAPATRETMVLAPEVHRRAVECIEPLLRKPKWRKVGPYAAVIYYRLSAADLMFGPDEVREVIEDRELRPIAPYAAAVAERSFHAGYKGLEAIIGGKAPKEDQKLRQRLTKVEIDPDAKLVIPDERDESMIARVRHLESVRNTLAAHGGNTGTERSLTYYDVMEVQWVLAAAIGEVVTARLAATA